MIDVGELEMVRASLAHVLAARDAADVPGALLSEGWTDLVETDPPAAITALCEEAGRLRSAAPVADVALLWAAGVGEIDTTAVVYPDLGRARHGGSTESGVALAGAERATGFVVLGDAVARAPSAAVTRTASPGFDPALALTATGVEPTALEPMTTDAARVLAVGRLALASQMMGAVQQMLAETLDYVTARRQYGRAIGSFQTVKHRLAEVKVAATAAAAAVRAAWEVGDDASAMAAKALAGRAQLLASTHCFQVHGGIAFTVEHGFQQWVRRGLLLDALLGGHEALTAELGRRIVAAGAVPRVPALGSPPAPP